MLYYHFGIITSLGYNLIQTTTGCTLTGTLTGVIAGVNPLLGPLSDNLGTAIWALSND